MVAPLFAPSLAALKASLRLSAVEDGDALVMVEDAVREVNLGFARQLGLDAVAALVAIAYDPAVAAPATTDEVRREVANTTEIAWVRMLLLQRLPTIFRDSSGDAMLAWQNDALTRETGDSQRRAMIEALDAQIKDGLEMLLGDDEPDAATFSATTFEPDPDKNPAPGDSMKNWGTYSPLGD